MEYFAIGLFALFTVKHVIADYVLQNFDEEESIGIEKISNNITESISILVEKKLDLFSSTVNNN